MAAKREYAIDKIVSGRKEMIRVCDGRAAMSPERLKTTLPSDILDTLLKTLAETSSSSTSKEQIYRYQGSIQRLKQDYAGEG